MKPAKLSNSPEAVRKRAARARAREERERARAAEEPESEPEPEAAESAPEAEGAPDQPEVPAPANEPAPELGNAPPPPGLHMSSDRSEPRLFDAIRIAPKESEWHRKWREQMHGAGSRETLCEKLADQGVQLLAKLDAVLAAGVVHGVITKPTVTSEDMRPALVLTIDQLMPRRLDAIVEKPVVALLVGTGIMAGQSAAVVAAIKSGKVKPATEPAKPAPAKPAPPAQPEPAKPEPAKTESPIKPAAPAPPPAAVPARASMLPFKVDADGRPVL